MLITQLPALQAAWGCRSKRPCRIRGRGGRWEVLLPQAYETQELERRALPMSPPRGNTGKKLDPLQSSKVLLEGQRMKLRKDAPENLLSSLSPHWRL